MNFIDSFVNFIDKLPTSGLVLLIMTTISIILLISMCIALAAKNTELRGIICELSKNKKENVKEPESIKKAVIVKREIGKEEDKKEPMFEEEAILENPIYEKDFSKDNKRQTSSITIGKTIDVSSLRNDVQKLEPIEIEETYEDVNDGRSTFVEEISAKLKKASEEPITEVEELDRYEKEEEEDAVISYEELLKRANNNEFINDEEENEYSLNKEDDDEFLKELKSFRDNLR